MAEAPFKLVGLFDTQIFGLPVDRDVLFSNHKDVYKKRIEKRQRKLIVKLSFIKPFLKTNEQIQLITTGYSPLNSLAQYLTGFLFVYLKRSLFVFTNFRILHIPVTSKYNYRNSLSQVTYAGCQSTRLKGGALIVQHVQAGKKKIERFKGIALSERRKVRSLFMKQKSLSGNKGRPSVRTHLCPRCTHMLAKGIRKCKKCQLQFKSKTVAWLSALFIPGGGYFYIRQYLLGSFDALLELVLIGLIVYLVNELRVQMPVETVYLALIPAFLYLKIAVAIHSSHFIEEFIPKDRNIKPRTVKKNKNRG